MPDGNKPTKPEPTRPKKLYRFSSNFNCMLAYELNSYIATTTNFIKKASKSNIIAFLLSFYVSFIIHEFRIRRRRREKKKISNNNSTGKAMFFFYTDEHNKFIHVYVSKAAN